MYKRFLPNVSAFVFITTMSLSSFPGTSSFAHMHALSVVDQPIYSAPPQGTQTNGDGEQAGIITHGSRDTKKIALTFDADMNPHMKELNARGVVSSWYNAELIKTLTKTQTKATLFMSGMWIQMYPTVTQELAANPLFELSNHSYSHPSFDGHCYGLTQLPDHLDEQEIQKTQQLLREVAHVDNSYFRFPGGCYSQTDLEAVSSLGMRTVHWDVVGGDGFTTDAEHIVHNVLTRTQNGSIIVLHMHGGPNAPKTAEAVAKIIPELKNRGYVFVKVSELLDN